MVASMVVALMYLSIVKSPMVSIVFVFLGIDMTPLNGYMI